MVAKEIYFSCVIRCKNIYVTGNVILRGNKFSGAMAYDYLEGLLTNGTLEFNLYEAIKINDYIFFNQAYAFLNAKGKVNELKVPKKYLLRTQDGNDFSIEFLNVINNPKKQREILEEIQFADRLRSI